MATFCMMVIIVLVNLLIAMMSKTHDSVCDKGIRETEWSFYMMNLWVKFIRRDFVAPIPMNILPHFHKHLCSEKALWRSTKDEQKPKIDEVVVVENSGKEVADRKKSIAKAVPTLTQKTSMTNMSKSLAVTLSEGETILRNEKYEQIVYTLCKRYRRKHLIDE